MKQIPFKKIFVSSFIILIIFSGIVFVLKDEPLIKSYAGEISQGSFNYLTIYFDALQDDAHEKIFDTIKTYEAKGILATKLGLKQDPSYDKFLFLAKRYRINKLAKWYLEKKIGHNFTSEDVYQRYEVVLDPNAVDKISQDRIKENASIYIKHSDLKIGTWKNGAITIDMVKEILLDEEWKQFLSLSDSPMKEILPIYMLYFVYNFVNKEILDFLNADNDELKRFDHSSVANRYLTAKYGMAGDGIYPTYPISIEFSPKELFDHFQKIKHRFETSKQGIEVKFSEYRDAVMMDLANSLLRKQYPIDINDTIKSLNFKISTSIKSPVDYFNK